MHLNQDPYVPPPFQLCLVSQAYPALCELHWNVTHQAPLSVEFSQAQEYWSGWHALLPGDHPNPGVIQVSHTADGFFCLSFPFAASSTWIDYWILRVGFIFPQDPFRRLFFLGGAGCQLFSNQPGSLLPRCSWELERLPSVTQPLIKRCSALSVLSLLGPPVSCTGHSQFQERQVRETWRHSHAIRLGSSLKRGTLLRDKQAIVLSTEKYSHNLKMRAIFYLVGMCRTPGLGDSSLVAQRKLLQG